MFRMRKIWVILTFSVLALLVGATISSFAFKYEGIHWYDADLPVTWEMNQNGTADCTDEFQAVQSAYQTWENVVGSYFTETYLGTTSRTGPAYDYHNVASWGHTEDSIATCYYWYYPSTGRLVEFDIVFEDDYTWSSTGEAGKMDVQNLAIHEFGHTLNLKDLYGSGDTEKTMYGYASPGETKKRTLHQDDIDGIRHIYPAPVAPVLEVDPSSLDFGELGKGSSQTMTFRAYNAGGGTLSGTISDNRDWISVSPTSFEGNDNTISVTVSTEGLAESHTPYTGTVTVTSNGGTRTVEVSAIVIPTGAVPYPNPFSLSRHTKLTLWGTSVPGGKIQIYNLAGELIRTLHEQYGASKVLWDGRNEKGEKVATGIYIYPGGKIAVVE